MNKKIITYYLDTFTFHLQMVYKKYALNFLGILAGTFIYNSIIQFLFTYWVNEVQIS